MGNIHQGHRQRMRRKFSVNGARVFDTYELLEMLLYHVIPYKDTNPVSKNLLERFGGADGVFKASADELKEICGIGNSAADFISSVGRIVCDKKLISSVGYGCYDDYKKTGRMIAQYFEKCEDKNHLVALFLFDNNMNFIGAKTLFEFDYASGAVRADAFLNFAIANRASVAISAHTHKNGPLFPSIGDIETNKLVSGTLETAGITHIEHYLLVGSKFLGITSHLKSEFRQSPEITRFLESKEERICE